MLQVGDKIRIFTYPKMACPLHKSTKRVYDTLIARKRSVRISRFVFGTPQFECRTVKNGKINYHFLTVLPDDENWVKVKPRLGPLMFEPKE